MPCCETHLFLPKAIWAPMIPDAASNADSGPWAAAKGRAVSCKQDCHRPDAALALSTGRTQRRATVVDRVVVRGAARATSLACALANYLCAPSASVTGVHQRRNVGLPQSSLAPTLPRPRSTQHRDNRPPASTPPARPSLAARPRTLTRPDCALAAPNDGCPGLPRLSPGPSGNICHTLCHACRRVPPSEPDQCRPHVTAFGRPRKSLTPRIGEAKRAAQSRLQPWPGDALQARPRHCRVRRHTSQALTDGPLQDCPERPQGEPLAVVFRPSTARRARQHLLDHISGVRQPYLVSARKRRSIHSRSKRRCS